MKMLPALFLCVIYGFQSIDALSFENILKTNADDVEQRIIGGADAQRYQFPYIVSLQYAERHLCGGSIIAPSWVVTAGHCCEKETNFDPIYYVVVAGLLNQGEYHPDIQSVQTAQVIIHPSYYYIAEPGEMDYDIALLKLASPLKYNNAVKPIALPFANQIFSEGWLAGWGTYIRPGMSPTTLQYLKMPIVTNEACRNLLSNFKRSDQLTLFDSMFCAVPPTGGEVGCHGDSGGPIAANGVLIGIASWVVNCEEYLIGAPTVFTAVSKFTDFIQTHVNEI